MYIYVFVLTYYVNMSQRDTLQSLGVMDEARGGDDSQRRHRQYTEKGLAYLLEVKCKRRSHVFKQLERRLHV